MKFRCLAVLLVLVAAASGCTQTTGSVAYDVADGSVSYSQRPPPAFEKEPYNVTGGSVIYLVKYQSRGATIFALLGIPDKCSEASKCPAFAMLHAQGLRKQGEQRGLGTLLNGMGFITLAIDQRGHGDTGGEVPGMNEELQSFTEGKETVQSKMVHDALAAYDLLASLPEADAGQIYLSGQSMGGRFATIAAAIEPRIKGLLLVSTAGYGLQESGFENVDEFYRYIDPDNYIGTISPRKVLMVHGTQDWIIPLETAEKTFSYAKEPKKLLVVGERFHGYYNLPVNSTLPAALKEGVEWLAE